MRCVAYLASLSLAVFFTSMVVGEPAPSIPPIKEIKAQPDASVFKDAARNKPIEIRSAREAVKYFSKTELAKLEKQVDFDKQFVLVFAWRGSGQDKLTYAVAESFPEQVFFSIQPGRTRDLRPHVHVYALRSNVKWSVKGKR